MQHTVAILAIGDLTGSCETTTISAFHQRLMSVCLPVCVSHMWVNVLICLTCLSICLSVCQSICWRKVHHTELKKAKCLFTHEDLTIMGLWSLSEGISVLKLLTADIFCRHAMCLNVKTLMPKTSSEHLIEKVKKASETAFRPCRDSKTLQYSPACL